MSIFNHFLHNLLINTHKSFSLCQNSCQLCLSKHLKGHRFHVRPLAISIKPKPYSRSQSIAEENLNLRNQILKSSFHNFDKTSIIKSRQAHAKALPNSDRLPVSPTPPSLSSPPDPANNKPSVDQLLKVYNCLQTNLPKLFTHPMDYSIYTQDILLINNILNKTTQGLFKYVQQVAFLRMMGHLKFAYVRLELVSMSQDHLQGRITVRWRVVGISGLRVMLKFWKFKLWKWQEIMNQQELWYDAISHYDVGADGLVFRNIVDRVEEDKERLEAQKTGKSPLIAKLALLAALFPRGELGDAISYGSLLQYTTASVDKQNDDAGNRDYRHIHHTLVSHRLP